MAQLFTFRRWLCLCLAALALAGCGHREEGNAPLRVGMELAYPPFEMTDPQGAPAGVSVDLARALGEQLHRPVQIENLPFTGLIPALRTGRIDLILSSLTVTEERRQAIAFSEPYLKTGLALLVRKGGGLRRLEDLRAPGRTVAVKKGTTGYFFASAQLPGVTLRQLDQESACVLEVAQGKADAFIYDQLSIWRHARQHAETTEALLTPLTEEAWAIGLRPEDTALRQSVNTALAGFRAPGGLFEKLGERWLGEPKQAFAAAGIPFVF